MVRVSTRPTTLVYRTLITTCKSSTTCSSSKTVEALSKTGYLSSHPWTSRSSTNSNSSSSSSSSSKISSASLSALCLLKINSLTASQEPRLPRRLVKSFAMPKIMLQGKILSTICSISKSAMTQLRLRALKKLNKSQCSRKRHELSLA